MKQKKLIIIIAVAVVLLLTGGIILGVELGKKPKNGSGENPLATLGGTEIRFLYCEEINSNTYSIKVDYTRTNLDLGELVQVNPKSTWILAKDISGNNAIKSNIASNLTIGNNLYYVLVTAKNGQKKMYTFYIYRRAMFTVTFNTNGGDSIASQTIQEDSQITRPNNPTKTGYTFTGWDKDLTLPITANMTINASWSVNKYTVTYHSNNGENITLTQQVTYDTQYTTKPDTTFTNQDLYLYGWSTTPNGVIIYDVNEDFYPQANDLNLYAYWMPYVSYTVSFNLNGSQGGVAPKPQTVDIFTGLSYPLPPLYQKYSTSNPSYDNYIFAGWYENSACTGEPYDFTATVTADITLYAKWVECELPYNKRYKIISVGDRYYNNIYDSYIAYFIPLVTQTITVRALGYDTALCAVYGYGIEGQYAYWIPKSFTFVAGHVYTISPQRETATFTIDGIRTPPDGGKAGLPC